MSAGQVLFSQEDISLKLKDLGTSVARDYADKQPVVMPILKVRPRTDICSTNFS